MDQKGKRGARACLRCRASKRQCDGREPTCERCQRAGSDCVFDKAPPREKDPAVLAMEEEATSSRLATIESQLAGIERRQDLLLMAMSELTNKLSGTSAGPAAAAPSPSFNPLNDSSPLYSGPSDINAASMPSTSAQLPSMNPNNIHLLAAATDAFALSVHAPMRAMDEAEVPNEFLDVRKVNSLTEDGGVDGEDDSDERPQKRPRLTILSESSWTRRPDIVEKGRMSEREARSLVLLWMKELFPFCAVLDRKHDTFQSLRDRSPFLFDTVVYTALRAKTGVSKPSKALIAAADETRTFAMNLILERSPSVETIQALVIIASWHEDPYLVSGFGLRLALSARYDRLDEELQTVGWTGTAEGTRLLTAKLRAWLYLNFLDSRHSRSSGRPVMQHESEQRRLLFCAAGLLESPLLTADDVRTICNLRLVVIERQIELAAVNDFTGDDDFSRRISYIQEMRLTVKTWHETHDAHLARFMPHPQEWGRRSHYRHFLDVNLFLACTVLKHALLDPAAPPPVREVARAALDHALGVIREVLRSHVYSTTIRHSGFLTRVDVSFAALMSLKLAHLFGDDISSEEVSKDVQGVIDLLSQIPSARRYVLVLKNARRQYLELKQVSSSSAEPLTGLYPCWIDWSQEIATSVPQQPMLPGELDWPRIFADMQGGSSEDPALHSLGQLDAWPAFSFGFEEL